MHRKDNGDFPKKTKMSPDHLNKVLKSLRRMLQNYKNVDRSACEDMVESIDNLLQSGNKDSQDGMLLVTICQAVDVLSAFIEESDALKENIEAENDLFTIGKTLERTYIESVEIEQAQFFVKEIAIKIENLLSKKCFDPKKNILLLSEKADALFEEIKAKCERYFKENIREIEEKPQAALTSRTNSYEIANTKIEFMKDQQVQLIRILQNLLDPAAKQVIPSSLGEEMQTVLIRLRNQLKASKRSAFDQIKILQESIQNEVRDFSQRFKNLQLEVAQKATLEKDFADLHPKLLNKQKECAELLKALDISRMQQELLEEKFSSAESQIESMKKQLELQEISRASNTEQKSERENLKQIIREDSKNLKELLSKYEAKCVETNELSIFKEKYNSVKEENLKLTSTQTKLEKDYLLFHEELKKLKEKVKSLLNHNDDLMSEKIIYESKVGTLEDKIMALKAKKKKCALIREKYANKDLQKASKHPQDQNVLQSSIDQNSFYATVRKKDVPENSFNFLEKNSPAVEFSADCINPKILRFNEWF